MTSVAAAEIVLSGFFVEHSSVPFAEADHLVKVFKKVSKTAQSIKMGKTKITHVVNDIATEELSYQKFACLRYLHLSLIKQQTF